MTGDNIIKELERIQLDSMDQRDIAILGAAKDIIKTVGSLAIDISAYDQDIYYYTHRPKTPRKEG